MTATYEPRSLLELAARTLCGQEDTLANSTLIPPELAERAFLILEEKALCELPTHCQSCYRASHDLPVAADHPRCIFYSDPPQQQEVWWGLQHAQRWPDPDTPFEVACKRGRYDCIRLLHEHGVAWPKDAKSYLMRSGSLACLRYAHEHGCVEWDSTDPWILDIAAGRGDLKCLRYACENGCPVNDGTLDAAVRSGDLSCVRYVQEERGVRLWEGRAKTAVYYGQLECLRYLHSQGCPFPKYGELARIALRQKQFDCFCYLVDNDPSTCELIFARGMHDDATTFQRYILRYVGRKFVDKDAQPAKRAKVSVM